MSLLAGNALAALQQLIAGVNDGRIETGTSLQLSAVSALCAELQLAVHRQAPLEVVLTSQCCEASTYSRSCSDSRRAPLRAGEFSARLLLSFSTSTDIAALHCVTNNVEVAQNLTDAVRRNAATNYPSELGWAPRLPPLYQLEFCEQVRRVRASIMPSDDDDDYLAMANLANKLHNVSSELRLGGCLAKQLRKHEIANEGPSAHHVAAACRPRPMPSAVASCSATSETRTRATAGRSHS